MSSNHGAKANNCTIINNEFHNCTLWLEHLFKFIISNNIIFINEDVSSSVIYPIYLGDDINLMNIENNNINAVNSIKAIYYSQGGYNLGYPHNVVIKNNILNYGGVYFENAYNLSIIGNTINRNNSISSIIQYGISIGISLSPSDLGIDNYGSLIIQGNQINGNPSLCVGIELSSVNDNYKYDTINIAANSIEGATNSMGISILQATSGTDAYWARLLVASSNTIDLNIIDENAYSIFASYILEINPSQEVWISKGNPNKLISAPQGSIAIDKTMVADNNYSKNQIKEGTFGYTDLGWELISEMGKQTIFRTYFPNSSSSAINLLSDIPEIDVFSSSPPWDLPLTGTSWLIGANNGFTYAHSLFSSSGNVNDKKALAIMKGDKDFELKAFLKCVVPPVSAYSGIVFRYGDIGNYFQFYLEVNGTGTTAILKCDLITTIGGTTTVTNKFTSTSSVPLLEQFVLKVNLKDEIISLFYNELILYNFKGSALKDNNKHGLVTYQSIDVFYYQNFKQLIP